MRKVLLVSGRTSSGKSGLARRLSEEYGYFPIRTSEILRQIAHERGVKVDRNSLQRLGDELDADTDHRWVLDRVAPIIANTLEGTPIVIDCVRTAGQLKHFRSFRDYDVIHAHLYAPATELTERFLQAHPRMDPANILKKYRAADLMKNHSDIVFFKNDADVRINTGRTDSRDTLIRVAARLGLLSPSDTKCVDVIVGGQYGSEGKGHVAAYLSKEYDVLVRVGGPNAGHSVSSGSGVYVYHQLPSGSKDTDAKLLLGPGMTINVDKLLREIADCGVTPERLFIDPQAMIISDRDIASEKGLVATIASTGQGGGAAAARRITDRKDQGLVLARDVPQLLPYVGDGPNYRGSTSKQLEVAYSQGLSILLEGTQGSALSLFHGQYPYVTSRDTNVAGCLSEAGISPSRVRRILMVVRSTPIRVGDPDGSEGHTSGRLRRETTFEAVAKGARLDPAEVVRYEKTSTTNRPRRIGWFEWEQFRLACSLNGPTDIVLTFADYIDVKNREARRFEQLTEETIKFVEELERVSHAPVSLINTRFNREAESAYDIRSIIDRRSWLGRRRSADMSSK